MAGCRDAVYEPLIKQLHTLEEGILCETGVLKAGVVAYLGDNLEVGMLTLQCGKFSKVSYEVPVDSTVGGICFSHNPKNLKEGQEHIDNFLGVWLNFCLLTRTLMAGRIPIFGWSWIRYIVDQRRLLCQGCRQEVELKDILCRFRPDFNVVRISEKKEFSFINESIKNGFRFRSDFKF